MSREYIEGLEKRVIGGGEIDGEQALKLITLEGAQIYELFASANRIARHFKGWEVELCGIVNAKSGRCQEDCAFCSQSVHYDTEAPTYPLKPASELAEAAICGEGDMADRFGIVTSGTGIANNARSVLDRGEDAPELARIAAEISPRPLSAVHVSQAADLGDPAATVILERARRAVAVAVVSIVNVFGPDVVILGGGIALAWGERLIAPARVAVAESAFRIQAERVKIVGAALGDDVGLIGTVPLVASALPELVVEEDHQGAAAVSADATT